MIGLTQELPRYTTTAMCNNTRRDRKLIKVNNRAVNSIGNEQIKYVKINNITFRVRRLNLPMGSVGSVVLLFSLTVLTLLAVICTCDLFVKR